ncbi:MAG: hypothetical protein ACJ8FY_28580 [Gemmataceae bacterium]
MTRGKNKRRAKENTIAAQRTSDAPEILRQGQPTSSSEPANSMLPVVSSSPNPQNASLADAPPWEALLQFTIKHKMFSAMVGLVAAIYACIVAAATLFADHQILDYRIAKSVDEKVGSALKDFENRARLIEKENETSRKAMECYSEMQVAKCRHDFEAVLLAKDELFRIHLPDSIPNSLRLVIHQETLNALVERRKFELLSKQEVDSIAAFLDRTAKPVCSANYLYLGICYLCLNQVEEAKKRFLHALEMNQRQLQEQVVVDRAIAGMIVSSLAETRQSSSKDSIRAGLQMLDDCEALAPASYSEVYLALVGYEEYGIVQFLRLTSGAISTNTFNQVLEYLKKNSEKITEVEENGSVYLRGTVTQGGKPIQINRYLGPSPSHSEMPKPKEMKKEDAKKGC